MVKKYKSGKILILQSYSTLSSQKLLDQRTTYKNTLPKQKSSFPKRTLPNCLRHLELNWSPSLIFTRFYAKMYPTQLFRCGTKTSRISWLVKIVFTVKHSFNSHKFFSSTYHKDYAQLATPAYWDICEPILTNIYSQHSKVIDSANLFSKTLGSDSISTS